MEYNQKEITQTILWGATGQAKVLHDCLNNVNIQIVALFDNSESVKSPFENIPLYHGTKEFENWIKSAKMSDPLGCLVAIGGNRGKDRIEIQDYLVEYGCVPLIAKHPSAVVAESVRIGWGSQILANSTICVGTQIGSASIVNTGAIVDHECKIGDGVHIGPGTTLAGSVEVANFSTIYTGAVVLPRINIGEGAVVGAGAVVTKDVGAYDVVVGNPAKIIRKATH